VRHEGTRGRCTRFRESLCISQDASQARIDARTLMLQKNNIDVGSEFSNRIDPSATFEFASEARLVLIPARLLRLGHPLQSRQPEIVAAMHQGLVALT